MSALVRGGGLPPGTTLSRTPPALSASHEIARLRFACTQKIRVPGGSPPPLTSSTRAERAPDTEFRKSGGYTDVSEAEHEGRAGGPAASLDPYLLGTGEATTGYRRSNNASSRGSIESP